ncbi:MAG: diguanylate cyclase, partial [Magnetococcales bacterium]|nr:diguanylate cyclase [Magnetococcales bacterium]
MLQKNPLEKKINYHYWFVGVLIIYGGIIAATTIIVNYNVKFSKIQTTLDSEWIFEQIRIIMIIREYISGFEEYLYAISVNREVSEFLSTKSVQARSYVNSLFVSMAISHQHVFQVRLIAPNGKELVRVDRQWGTTQVAIVPEEGLQDKSDRYYFIEAMKLRPGEFWLSAVDLNVEHGRIERPIKPTLRVATPIFNNKTLQAILIINLHVGHFLDVLGASTNFSVYVIDKDGEYIFHPTPGKSWSRYLPGRTNLAQDFPAIAQAILNSPSISTEEFFSFDISDKFPTQDRLKVVLSPLPSYIDSLESTNILSVSIIGAFVFVTSIILAWLIAIYPTKVQTDLNIIIEKLNEYHQMVDKNIYTSSTDQYGNITSVSTAFCDAVQYSALNLVGSSHKLIRHPDTPGEVYRVMWEEYLLQGKVWRGELRNRKKNGEDLWQEIVITPQVDGTGQISGYIGIGKDISDKKAIERFSRTDQLTKLFNRHLLSEVLHAEVDRYQRFGAPFSWILVAVDRYEWIVDTFGHQAADDALIHFADILKQGVRQMDMVGRWAHGQFIVVCPSTSRHQAADL